MRNSLASGRRVALLTVLLQGLVILATALIFAVTGSTKAWGVLVGGGIIASGNLILTWRLFGRRVKTAGSTLASVLLGQVLRWMWIGGGLVLAMAGGFDPVGVLIGAAVALLAQLGGLLIEQ
ncbi:MAG: ATP synthase subunit I [Dokdonella sp.]